MKFRPLVDYQAGRRTSDSPHRRKRRKGFNLSQASKAMTYVNSMAVITEGSSDFGVACHHAKDKRLPDEVLFGQ